MTDKTKKTKGDFAPQRLITADGLCTLMDKVKRRLKTGWRLVPGSAQCVDRQNAYGWWAVMEEPEKQTDE